MLENFEILNLITSIVGLGGLVSLLFTHYLVKQRDKDARLFQSKREVYGKALAVLSIPHDVDDYSLFKENLTIISEAILLADTKLRESLILQKRVRYLLIDVLKTVGESNITLSDELTNFTATICFQTEHLMKRELGIRTKGFEELPKEATERRLNNLEKQYKKLPRNVEV